MKIVRARPSDAFLMTRIAQAAKRHWGYPEEWLKAWRDQLSVRPDYVLNEAVFIAVAGGKIVGFYSLVPCDEGLELDHMWVQPERMGNGIGRDLFRHAVGVAKARDVKAIRIESDPNAAGFYEHMGAREVGEVESFAPGVERRTLPLLIYDVPEE